MPLRADFDSAWPEFIANWCLGVAPITSSDVTFAALNTVERLWPEYLDQLVQVGTKGISVIAPAIHLGLALAACEHMENFDRVLLRIKAGEVSAISEVTFVAALARIGYFPSFEPLLNGQKLDAVFDAENQQVYAEVIAPERSEAMNEAQKAMEHLALSLVDANPGASIEVLFQAEIGAEASEEILRYVQTAPLVPEVQNIPDVAFIIKQQPAEGSVISPKIESSMSRLILGYGLSRQDGSAHTIVAVRLPMSDERVQRLLSAELHHFSKDEVNLLVINTSQVPGGIPGWVPLLNRCFQPTRNRRVGAVVLYDQALAGIQPAIRQRWRVLRNQHAHKQPSEILLHKIETLDESKSWQE